ncbi:MAG: transaldolase [Gammaproteobacteria bacterium]|nr:transaldolase [Gammaproteobacteria bacterium]
MTSKLEQLKQYTTLVADTGDVSLIARLKPQDATTNPSLLLKAAQQQQYAGLLQQARDTHKTDAARAATHFAVTVGLEISQLIPGRISTEVDARLSFDEEATYAAALQLIEAYQARGLDKERILIKIAATWEGIRAAERLEKQGIQTNLTLLFSFAQAAACADAGVYLISPFVGRIYDWYKKSVGQDYSGLDDPGVQSVSRIYRYYKTNGFDTVVMGASFRNTGQIEALAGCDRLTISPELISQLAAETGTLQRQLSPEQVGEARIKLDQATFRWAHNEDAMATEKLAEGIRAFAVDQHKLEALFA